MGSIVPLDNKVLVAVGRARPTQRRKQEFTVDGTGYEGAVEFIQDREGKVTPLNNLGVAGRKIS